MKKQAIDLIEMEESFGWAEEVARRVSVPVVVRLHGPWCVTGRASRVAEDGGFRERVDREGRGIAAAAAITAPSHSVLEATREYYGLPLKHARVIPNPAGVATAEPETDERPKLSGPVVLYVGRFEHLKGGDLAILAFAELARQCENTHFVFIGPDNGLKVDSGPRTSAHEFITQHFPDGLRDRMHYLGQQPPSAVNAWRSRADVIILTSRYENFPMALLEAMGAAKPVVATAVGGIPEILTHGQTGLLAKPECVTSLVQSIQRLLNDPSLAGSLGSNAQRDVQQRFSVNTVVQQTVAFYDSILQTRKSSRD